MCVGNGGPSGPLAVRSFGPDSDITGRVRNEDLLFLFENKVTSESEKCRKLKDD